MIQYSIVTEQPGVEPVSLAEAKTHLEYSGSAKDSYILALITVARKLCETYTGLSFVTQTRQVKLDFFPCKPLYIQLAYGPVQSMESFIYTKDDDSTETMVEGTNFLLDTHSRIARVYPIGTDGTVSTWPTDFKNIPHPITLEYQAGYDDVSGEPLPTQIKHAILMCVASMFENRGDELKEKITALPWECMAMLDSIKVSWNANLE